IEIKEPSTEVVGISKRMSVKLTGDGAHLSQNSPSNQTTTRAGKIVFFVCAAMVIATGAIRYFQFPTFWLDEAFVAESLRDPTLQHIFGPLWHGQYFPRLYLTVIVGLRELLGYK